MIITDMGEFGTFLDFITEKQSALLLEAKQNKGELAEVMLWNLFKKYHRLPADQEKPAGFSAHDIDLSFIDKTETVHNLEVKYELTADFGQFELIWNWKGDRSKTKGVLGGEWTFRNYNSESKDAVERERAGIADELKRIKILDKINAFWYDIPNLYAINPPELTMRHREQDRKNFPDRSYPLDSKFIGNYYRSKNVHYIQICTSLKPGKGSYGLYHFGTDPANTGCKEFKPDKCILRIRRKPRDGSKNRRPTGYGFVAALKVSGLEQSSVDLANPQDLINVLGGSLAQKTINIK